MFSEKNIVVTIGNYGAVVALHENNDIKNKIFLDELNDAAKEELKGVFLNHKSAPIYVLLDTVDQSYKKKVYPSVRRSDLSRIIKRDLASDGDKESMKNYIILNQKRSSGKQQSANRWETLFVSSSNSEIINKWLEFLLDMPNRLVGIYMLPIETFNLFKRFKNFLKVHSKVQNKKNDLYCMVMQNKVSGIRQVVFSDQGIVFTRVVNYNFEQPDFLEKYEQDIYSTFEYLKRLFPDLSITELDIVNIFPAEVLEKLKNLHNIELNFINYTPYQVASEIGYSKILPQNSHFCDLLISKVFSKEKKILKFTIPKISLLEKFFTVLQISYYLNILFFLAICASGVYTIFAQDAVEEQIEVAETEKFSALQELTKLRQSAMEGTQELETGEEVDVERITDFGKIEEALGNVGTDYIEFYIRLKFLKEFNMKLNGFTYSVANFNQKSPSANDNYKIVFDGEIFNKSGDIEDLFREYDVLVSEVKRNLPQYQIKASELPRNIDFNQKYYSFPVDFTVTKGAAPTSQQ